MANEEKSSDINQRYVSTEVLAEAIKAIPDYSQLDTRGFVSDVFQSFKREIVEIWSSERRNGDRFSNQGE